MKVSTNIKYPLVAIAVIASLSVIGCGRSSLKSVKKATHTETAKTSAEDQSHSDNSNENSTINTSTKNSASSDSSSHSTTTNTKSDSEDALADHAEKTAGTESQQPSTKVATAQDIQNFANSIQNIIVTKQDAVKISINHSTVLIHLTQIENRFEGTQSDINISMTKKTSNDYMIFTLDITNIKTNAKVLVQIRELSDIKVKKQTSNADSDLEITSSDSTKALASLLQGSSFSTIATQMSNNSLQILTSPANSIKIRAENSSSQMTIIHSQQNQTLEIKNTSNSQDVTQTILSANNLNDATVSVTLYKFLGNAPVKLGENESIIDYHSMKIKIKKDNNFINIALKKAPAVEATESAVEATESAVEATAPAVEEATSEAAPAVEEATPAAAAAPAAAQSGSPIGGKIQVSE